MTKPLAVHVVIGLIAAAVPIWASAEPPAAHVPRTEAILGDSVLRPPPTATPQIEASEPPQIALREASVTATIVSAIVVTEPPQTPTPRPIVVTPLPTREPTVVAQGVVKPTGSIPAAIQKYFPEQPVQAFNRMMCESGGDARIVSPDGQHFGLWQFALSTWYSVGGVGLPTNASADEQTMRARMVYDRAGGWSDWECPG